MLNKYFWTHICVYNRVKGWILHTHTTNHTKPQIIIQNPRSSGRVLVDKSTWLHQITLLYLTPVRNTHNQTKHFSFSACFEEVTVQLQLWNTSGFLQAAVKVKLNDFNKFHGPKIFMHLVEEIFFFPFQCFPQNPPQLMMNMNWIKILLLRLKELKTANVMDLCWNWY